MSKLMEIGLCLCNSLRQKYHGYSEKHTRRNVWTIRIYLIILKFIMVFIINFLSANYFAFQQFCFSVHH